MNVKADFEKWGLGYSGCDGGDIGHAQRRSKWICGIEWGGGHNLDSLTADIRSDVSEPPKGYDRWEDNLSYIFNWQVMKLLSAVEGGTVKDYKTFAKEAKPFVAGGNGYFKMNLYPIAFRNTNHSNWVSEYAGISGFSSKSDYIAWCKNKRLPQIRKWTSAFTPKLVVCLGKTYADDYAKAFFDDGKDFVTEPVDDCEIRWGINSDNTLVVILPFMVNRHGLTKNATIQKVGDRISQLMPIQ